MMSTKQTIARTAWVLCGALLALALGCSPPAATGKAPASGASPGASGESVDPSAPRASVVTPNVDDPNAVALVSTIRRVTVYSDRALVTRDAKAQLLTEPTVYALRHLPGWVDDGSVRVSTTAGRILDVRVSRSYLARATDQEYQRAEEAAQALESQLAALDDEIEVLDAQEKQVADIKAFSLEKLNKDVVIGNVGVSTYGSVVEFISKTLRETAKARREVEQKRTKLEPEIEAANRKLEEVQGLTQLEETNVFITLQHTAPVEASIVVTYMLPGATWEPMHELRATDADPGTVEVTSFAVVTQASGEDWNGAELTFSTQSSTAAVRIPELEALTLGDTKTATRILQQQSASFSRAETAFREQNRLWNKKLQAAGVHSNFEEIYQSNFDYLQVVQSKTVQIFQSLQERGTTAQFKAMARTNVRADGRSVRVPIGRSHLKAKHAIVAAPEQSLNAARTLDMLNESGQPLLPGKVALYMDGAFLGMTQLEFVADEERFSLFFGVADQIKLSRTLDKKHSSLVRRQRTLMQLAFVVTVENLSSKPVSLTLADRIPVSEDREIIVSGVKVKPDAKPDSKGILNWPLTLQPKEKRTFEIRYQIEYPPTLVLEMRRNQTPEPSPPPGMPAMPAPRRSYDLRKDIEQLEQAF